MENNEEVSIPSAARSCIGFPLGLALLLVLLFCMSGFLCCCLHWNKIRSLFRGFRDDDTDSISDSDQMNINRLYQIKPASLHMMPKKNQTESVLVSMPGDRVPKFLAMKCRPCEPHIPILDKVDSHYYCVQGGSSTFITV
ncbi:hypothetical protein Ddye_006535 [Dipteronia dyeriana]|uniref:Uncharacterized protein n=1 Tax=Dipteronia dyeriana TaxID=168575 RepID=A0AAD9XIU6_9ROSI|nr:hypothetical protein Ddye_006535 [Dipteronia dyeriana]